MQNMKGKYARALFIKPFSIEKFGRAVGISAASLFSEHPRCPFIFQEPDEHRSLVTISADGSFVPEIRCTYNGRMSLGKVGEVPLREYFWWRELLQQGLLKHMLRDNRSYDLRQVCKICAGYRQAKLKF